MSVIERLGFEGDARVVVVHVDDLGMSDAANQGGLEAIGGAATCGSVMVPCPSFEAIVQRLESGEVRTMEVHDRPLDDMPITIDDEHAHRCFIGRKNCSSGIAAWKQAEQGEEEESQKRLHSAPSSLPSTA